ncbi:uncharacterized protein B0T23DRAFT_101283 [Neurospora hispaniola]|uniref:Uncharacterized protein n=1 Tax=Neurospora hispaniola TaxID=588809 RepID=A0AAJ0IE59_9PEZI|nr:hypothetical protein B0T23DRAFT_101283 [Neurospora hispaniola]
MPLIKTEPGVRIKSEHEARFHFSSIPRPPVSSVYVKQEDCKPPSVFVKQEDRKPDFFLSPNYGPSRRHRRFRHARNFMVHRLRYGKTIRAHYNHSESTVVFTLSDGAASVIDDFPEEGHQAEETIFQRLQRANFNIQPIEPSGFLCREVQRQLSVCQSSPPKVISTAVQRTSGNIHAPEAIAKQEQTNSESKSLASTVHAKPAPLPASFFGRPQPATHILQVTSSTPVPQKPSESIFDISRPKDQSNIFSHPIPPKHRSSPSLKSSSDLTSGLAVGCGNQSTRSPRSIFSHSFSATESPFSSKSALWPTESFTGSSFLNPTTGPDVFASSLAATVKPSSEVIIIDSSPESSPAYSPQTKKRAAENQARSA